MSALPLRRICIRCRTLYAADESCPGGRLHVTVDLDDEQGRQRLHREVWASRPNVRQAASAGVGAATAGAVLEGCSACETIDADADVMAMFAALAVVGLVALAAFTLLRWLYLAVRALLHRPKPQGAISGPPAVKQRVVAARGVVVGAARASLPWSSETAVGYALQLGHSGAFLGGPMLRAAYTDGFDVQTDTGGVVRVPAGRLQVVGKLPQVSPEAGHLEAVVDDLGVGGRGQNTPVPFNRARGLAIQPGDRVEILGELLADASGTAAGYRAGGVWVPAGVPTLRVQRGARLPEPGVRLEDDGDEEAEAEAEAEAEQAHAEGAVR